MKEREKKIQNYIIIQNCKLYLIFNEFCLKKNNKTYLKLYFQNRKNAISNY